MSVFILRLQPGLPKAIKGTIEVPGGDPDTFQSGEELLEILQERTASSEGNGSGSTSNSPMRVT
jgi:hypothetical protein